MNQSRLNSKANKISKASKVSKASKAIIRINTYLKNKNRIEFKWISNKKLKFVINRRYRKLS
jgi:hypothetical protein